MEKMISIFLVFVIMLSTSACTVSESDQNRYDANSNNMSTESQKLWESEAISIAKESSSVKSAICRKFSLQFYSIDWGSTDAYYVDGAEKDFESFWVVTLYGNVSGYKDKYKTDYVIAEPFECEVRVYNDGDVGTPHVSMG